ncbi:hypothetical protein CR513_34493, partial [Mucuna pruriens]
VKPRPLAPSDDYQQVEIIKKRHGFHAISVATDGIPPDFLRRKEAVKVAGRDAVWDENGVVDRVLWFRSFDDVGREISVGLSLEVVERMKWEEERVGWKASNGRQESVMRVEEFRGTTKWDKFGCYMLVESFSLFSLKQAWETFTIQPSIVAQQNVSFP